MTATRMGTYAIAAVALLCSATMCYAQPRIEAIGRDLRLIPDAGGNIFMGDSGDNGNRFGTEADISSAISSLRSSTDADISMIRGSNGQISTTVSSLQSSIDWMAPVVSNMQQLLNTPQTCPTPTAPTNGFVTMPPELLPGSQISFSCDNTTLLSGVSTLYCLSNGTWSAPVPVCGPLPQLGSQSRPALSCKQIYVDRVSNGAVAPSSGAYYLQLRNSQLAQLQPTQVHCDMDTPSRDGLSGWTLCGKYDRDKADASNQYLSYGFGRAPSSIDDMSDLTSFNNPQKKWSSCDCRDIIDSGAAFMMHAGTDDPTQSRPFASQDMQVRYTNILPDVRANATNLFDTLIGDNGVCRTRNTGAIVTFNSSWAPILRDGNGTNLQGLRDGTCLVGDGHHMCTFQREGFRLSNAGSIGCQGSEADTIYWAWDDDAHGCNNYLRLGTGCQRRHSNGALDGRSSFRYNYLFLH